MKNTINKFIFILSFLIVSSFQIVAKEFPPHPIPQGISAPFAGLINDWMIVGGGCNFPDKPASEGGKKVYYQDIYAINLHDSKGKWILVGKLPQAAAYGATLSYQNALFFIGGENENEKLKSVYKVKLVISSIPHLVIETLPDLPETMTNISGTTINHQLYITGGIQEKGQNNLYSINLLSHHPQWEKQTPYPGATRIQSIVLGDGEKNIFLIGGFQLPTSKKNCQLSYNILCYNIVSQKWEELAQLPNDSHHTPRCMVGGSGVFYDGSLILTGGVNSTIFSNALNGKYPNNYLKHPVKWYQFNNDILIFNLKNKKWHTIPNVRGLAKAGGVLLIHQKSLYLICGEIKPGIRCNHVLSLPVPSLFK